MLNKKNQLVDQLWKKILYFSFSKIKAYNLNRSKSIIGELWCNIRLFQNCNLSHDLWITIYKGIQTGIYTNLLDIYTKMFEEKNLK